MESIAFNAFHSGLEVACLAGAGVAVLGALVAFRLLPGRGAPEVQLAAESPSEPASLFGLAIDTNPDRYPEYVPYVSA